MVEQNANMALSIASYGYVLQTGEVVLHGSAQSLRDNEMIQQAYLGRNEKAVAAAPARRPLRERARWPQYLRCQGGAAMPDTRVNFDLATALKDSERRYTAAQSQERAALPQGCRVDARRNTRTVLHYSPFPVAFRRRGAAPHRHRRPRLHGLPRGIFGRALRHSHPKIMAAAERALKSGIVLGGPNEYEADLAALVKGRFPSIDLIRFTPIRAPRPT